MIKVLLILMTWVVSFSPDMQGLRNIKVGDKLPSAEALSVFTPDESKLIMIMNSGRDRNITFFQELVPELRRAESLEFFLVDTAREPDVRAAATFETLEIRKKYINDADREIFGSLGIIVQPTLLMVTKENRLHSFIAGYRSNLKLIFSSHIEALKKGEPPEELSHKTERMKQERKIDRLLEQGFRLMISGNYILAQKAFDGVLDVDPEKETANLGIGYVLMFTGEIDEALLHFLKLKEKTDSRRVRLGYYLCEVLRDPTEESLKQIASLSQLEPQLFFVVFKVADTLDKAGKSEESKKAYRHAYEVLLRMFKK